MNNYDVSWYCNLQWYLLLLLNDIKKQQDDLQTRTIEQKNERKLAETCTAVFSTQFAATRFILRAAFTKIMRDLGLGDIGIFFPREV